MNRFPICQGGRTRIVGVQDAGLANVRDTHALFNRADFGIEKHLQCTEEKPECTRCVRLNLDCEYGIRLLWKEDAAQRNISLGREGLKIQRFN